jgi:hypothetical protein
VRVSTRQRRGAVQAGACEKAAVGAERHLIDGVVVAGDLRPVCRSRRDIPEPIVRSCPALARSRQRRAGRAQAASGTPRPAALGVNPSNTTTPCKTSRSVHTALIHGRSVVGSTLRDFVCVGTGAGDIYVRATYAVGDFIYGGGAPSYLSVTQEYRFRGIEPIHPCEPSGKLSCGRFWPSLTYAYGGPTSCVGQSGTRFTCGPLFSGIRTVQRIQFAPEGKENGGIDAYRDRNKLESVNGVSDVAVETKASGGAMRYEDVDQAIVKGHRGDWDSIHQSPHDAATGPNPFKFTPVCGECVHMHWAWDRVTNRLFGLVNLNPLYIWTDGEPEILRGSTQDADFGIVRYEDSLSSGTQRPSRAGGGRSWTARRARRPCSGGTARWSSGR